MRWRFDEEPGQVAIDFDVDGNWVRLRRPTVREWADWTMQANALRTRIVGAYDRAVIEHDSGRGSATERTATADRSVTAGPITALNWEIVSTLARVALPATVDEEHRWSLPLADLAVTDRMLAFWWECPLAPWPLGGADDVDDDEPTPPSSDDDGGERRKLGTDLPGGMGALSIMYQALATIGMGAGFSPRVIDDMEIWQVAVLMGRDGAGAGSAGDDGDVERGGRVKRRGDGQVGEMAFQRDPDQPRFFGPGADPAKTWAWLAAKRERFRRQAQRAQLDPKVREAERRAKQRRRRTWSRGLRDGMSNNPKDL